MDCFQGWGHSERVFDVQFHPRSSRAIASASEDTSVRIWRFTSDDDGTAAYTQHTLCRGHSTEVMRVAWSSSARLLASGSSTGEIKLWKVPEDIQRLEPMAAISANPAPTQNGNWLGRDEGQETGAKSQPWGFGHELTTLLVKNGNNSEEVLEEEVYALHFLSRDGGSGGVGEDQQLLSACADRLFLWDTEAGVKLQEVTGAPAGPVVEAVPRRWQASPSTGFIFDAAVNAAMGMVAAPCSDMCLRLFHLTTGPKQVAAIHQGEVIGPTAAVGTCCDFSSDGMRLAMSDNRGVVSIIDARMWRVAAAAQLPASSFRIRFLNTDATASRWLLAAGQDGACHAFDTVHGMGRLAMPLCSGTPLLCLDLAPDDSRLVCAAGEACVQPSQQPHASTLQREPGRAAGLVLEHGPAEASGCLNAADKSSAEGRVTEARPHTAALDGASHFAAGRGSTPLPPSSSTCAISAAPRSDSLLPPAAGPPPPAEPPDGPPTSTLIAAPARRRRPRRGPPTAPFPASRPPGHNPAQSVPQPDQLPPDTRAISCAARAAPIAPDDAMFSACNLAELTAGGAQPALDDRRPLEMRAPIYAVSTINLTT